MIDIAVGEKKLKVQVADTLKKREEGLLEITCLPNDTGMLFIWPKPTFVQMWMKGTLIPLDIIFINEDLEVIAIDHGKPEDRTLLGCDDVLYVIELNKNSGILIGDNLYMPDDKEKVVMKILAPDGSTQMELKGGERVISRRETKILVKKAKIAYLSESDSDYIKLGNYMFKILNLQDKAKPEYVTLEK